MFRYLKINKDLKLITNLYNNNHRINIRTFSSKKKNNDIILEGKIEYLSREDSSTESIQMLLDQLKNGKRSKSTTVAATTAPLPKKKSLANRDEIIEEDYENEVDGYEDDDEDFDDRIEIYDENDIEILDHYEENEDLEQEKRLEQYEKDENRMEGMEDYVFDDEIEQDIQDKNNSSSFSNNIGNSDSISNDLNINSYNDSNELNVNSNNSNNNSEKRVLTKSEKREARKRMEEKIRKQYGDKAEKIIHNIQMKHKYGKWNPENKISRKDMEHLRELYNENKEYYTIPVLAENFGISEGAVSRILRSKWQPTQEKLEKLHKKKVEENREKYSPYSKKNKNLGLSFQSKVGVNKFKDNSNALPPKVLPQSQIENIDFNNWYHQAKNYNKYRIEESKKSYYKFNRNNYREEKKEIDLNSKFEKIKQIEKLLK